MNVIYCSQCGNEVNENDKFCSNCGAELKNSEAGNNGTKQNKDIQKNDEDLNFEDMDAKLGKNSLSDFNQKDNSKKFDFKKLLLILAAIFIPIIGPILVIRSKRFKKTGKIIAGVWLSMILLTFIISPAENSDNQEQNITQNKETINNHNLEFTGKMNLRKKENKIIMNIESNVPDGGIFELSIMNSNFDVKSDFVEIKNGKIKKSFTIPEDWTVGYYSGVASFRFNLDDHPQPEKIKDIYGSNGENLKGNLVVETTTGGYNANLKTKTIAYPSQQAVDNKNNRIFNEKVNEVIENTNGVIVDIEKAFDDWKSVNVIVSDSWYYSAEHEKERFVKQVSDSVANLLYNTEKVDSDDYIQVYFVDTYSEVLAEPKMFGGHEIKK